MVKELLFYRKDLLQWKLIFFNKKSYLNKLSPKYERKILEGQACGFGKGSLALKNAGADNMARSSRWKSFGGQVGKDLAEKFEKFLQLY